METQSLTFLQDLKIIENEYLMYGRGVKHQNFFKRSKIFFNAKNQREFTLVTSEASF